MFVEKKIFFGKVVEKNQKTISNKSFRKKSGNYFMSEKNIVPFKILNIIFQNMTSSKINQWLLGYDYFCANFKNL